MAFWAHVQSILESKIKVYGGVYSYCTIFQPLQLTQYTITKAEIGIEKNPREWSWLFVKL